MVDQRRSSRVRRAAPLDRVPLPLPASSEASSSSSQDTLDKIGSDVASDGEDGEDDAHQLDEDHDDQLDEDHAYQPDEDDAYELGEDEDAEGESGSEAQEESDTEEEQQTPPPSKKREKGATAKKRKNARSSKKSPKRRHESIVDEASSEQEEEGKAVKWYSAAQGHTNLLEQVSIFDFPELKDKEVSEFLHQFRSGALQLAKKEETDDDHQRGRTVLHNGQVVFALLPRGHADGKKKRGKDPLEWTLTMFQDLAAGQTSLKAPQWMESKKTELSDLFQVIKERITSVGKAVAKSLAERPESLACQDFWEEFANAGLCLAQRAKSLGTSSSSKADQLIQDTACVYVIVGCKGGAVTSLYVGKSNKGLLRTLQHMACYKGAAEQVHREKRLVYQQTKAAETVFHFALTEFPEDNPPARALAEALWCSCLGTYQLSGEWLALRRLYGLPNVGEAVKGGNATRCVDRPANFDSSDRDGGSFGIQDPEWAAFRSALVPLVFAAAERKAAGDKAGCDAVVATIHQVQARVRERVSRLLLQGELRYKARDTEAVDTTTTTNWLFGSPIDRKFSRPLEEQGLNWKLRLVEVQADARSNLSTVQRLSRGLSLPEWRSRSKSSAKTTGSCTSLVAETGKTMPLRFAQRLFACLPAASRTSREAAAAAASALLQSERQKLTYDTLSPAARQAWDGHALITSGLRLQLDGEDIKITGQGQKERDEAHAALFRAIGAAPGWQAPSPCRFRLEDEGQVSFQDSRFRKVPKRYKVQIRGLNDEWIPLPFLIVGKGGNKRCDTDKLVEVFEELAASAASASAASSSAPAPAPAPAASAVPAQFVPYRISIQRGSREGKAYMVFGLPPKPYPMLTFSAEVMRTVFSGDWPVEYMKHTHIWVDIRGTGVRKVEELTFALSMDGTAWMDAATEPARRLALWRTLRERRRMYEESMGRPWEDGIWSYELED